jgi:ABC-type bacteriocin/lantibiotic exporter with double-glycine peptidase domain
VKAQRLTWWCGLAAASNALECLGIHVDQEELATHCHVTKKHGTDEHEVMRALLACKANVGPFCSRVRHKAEDWIDDQLSRRGPAVLSVDNEQHWVTVIGALCLEGHGPTDGERIYWVFDPATGEGLLRYTWPEVASRWRVANSRGGPSYYGIGVSK